MNKTVGKLEITTPSDLEIAMTRTFDAPRELVFDAWTKPELLQRWMGIIEGWSMPLCEIDLKIGGNYRYLWHGPEGAEMGIRGVFREIVPGERIVNTEKFDQPWYEGESIVTTELVERAGRTTVTMRVRYASKEIRDGVLQSPMAEGVAQSYNNLEEVLASEGARK